MKWTTKVAFHSIEESILNSFYLFDKYFGGQRLMQVKFDMWVIRYKCWQYAWI